MLRRKISTRSFRFVWSNPKKGAFCVGIGQFYCRFFLLVPMLYIISIYVCVGVQDLFQSLQLKNTFTGLTNFQQITCFLNVLLQLFCHTDFICTWMDADPQALPELKKHLADILQWHGKYECIAPVEVLHCIWIPARRGLQPSHYF